MIKFPEKKNCAAWYSIKSMLFTARSGMAGINCQATARFEKSGEGYRLVAEAALSGFDSGSKGRDKYFRNALKETERPALRFESVVYNRGQWIEILAGRGKTMQGEIFIGQKKFPVMFSLVLAGSSLKGLLIGKYDNFGLKPHMVGPFGMIARAENILEIHFQLEPGITEGMNLLHN